MPSSRVAAGFFLLISLLLTALLLPLFVNAAGDVCDTASETAKNVVSNDCIACVPDGNGGLKPVGASCTVSEGGSDTTASCVPDPSRLKGVCRVKYQTPDGVWHTVETIKKPVDGASFAQKIQTLEAQTPEAGPASQPEPTTPAPNRSLFQYQPTPEGTPGINPFDQPDATQDYLRQLVKDAQVNPPVIESPQSQPKDPFLQRLERWEISFPGLDEQAAQLDAVSDKTAPDQMAAQEPIPFTQTTGFDDQSPRSYGDLTEEDVRGIGDDVAQTASSECANFICRMQQMVCAFGEWCGKVEQAAWNPNEPFSKRTVYAPCVREGICPIQGGPLSHYVGPDGTKTPWSVDDVRKWRETGGKEGSPYAVIAVDPSRVPIGSKFVLPEITIRSPEDGKLYKLVDVPAVAVDTGVRGAQSDLSLARGATSDAQARAWANMQPFDGVNGYRLVSISNADFQARLETPSRGDNPIVLAANQPPPIDWGAVSTGWEGLAAESAFQATVQPQDLYGESTSYDIADAGFQQYQTQQSYAQTDFDSSAFESGVSLTQAEVQAAYDRYNTAEVARLIEEGAFGKLPEPQIVTALRSTERQTRSIFGDSGSAPAQSGAGLGPLAVEDPIGVTPDVPSPQVVAQVPDYFDPIGVTPDITGEPDWSKIDVVTDAFGYTLPTQAEYESRLAESAEFERLYLAELDSGYDYEARTAEELRQAGETRQAELYEETTAEAVRQAGLDREDQLDRERREIDTLANDAERQEELKKAEETKVAESGTTCKSESCVGGKLGDQRSIRLTDEQLAAKDAIANAEKRIAALDSLKNDKKITEAMQAFKKELARPDKPSTSQKTIKEGIEAAEAHEKTLRELGETERADKVKSQIQKLKDYQTEAKALRGEATRLEQRWKDYKFLRDGVGPAAQMAIEKQDLEAQRDELVKEGRALVESSESVFKDVTTFARDRSPALEAELKGLRQSYDAAFNVQTTPTVQPASSIELAGNVGRSITINWEALKITDALGYLPPTPDQYAEYKFGEQDVSLYAQQAEYEARLASDFTRGVARGTEPLPDSSGPPTLVYDDYEVEYNTALERYYEARLAEASIPQPAIDESIFSAENGADITAGIIRDLAQNPSIASHIDWTDVALVKPDAEAGEELIKGPVNLADNRIAQAGDEARASGELLADEGGAAREPSALEVSGLERIANVVKDMWGQFTELTEQLATLQREMAQNPLDVFKGWGEAVAQPSDQQTSLEDSRIDLDALTRGLGSPQAPDSAPDATQPETTPERLQKWFAELTGNDRFVPRPLDSPDKPEPPSSYQSFDEVGGAIAQPDERPSSEPVPDELTYLPEAIDMNESGYPGAPRETKPESTQPPLENQIAQGKLTRGLDVKTTPDSDQQTSSLSEPRVGLTPECASGLSAADCVQAQGQDWTTIRNQVSKQLGCAVGTASCNTQILQAIRDSGGIPPPLPTPRAGDQASQQYLTAVSRYPTGNSIVDFLNAGGIKSDFASRAAIAKEVGIGNYSGKGWQNVLLLRVLRERAQR